MKHTRIVSDESGMTLVEIMFAAGVAGTALAMMFGSLMAISVVGEISEQQTNALVQANSILEEIRGLTESELLAYRVPAITNGPGVVNVGVALAYDQDGIAHWLPSSSGTQYGGTPLDLPNPVEVRVLVVWLNDSGRVFSVDTSTYVGF